MKITNLETNKPLSKIQLFILVFFPFACAHFISFIFRAINAVLAPSIMSNVILTPTQLGIMTSSYFFAFALGQLPVGIALDRYGPRVIQCVLLSIATIGAILFAMGTNFIVLTIARAIIGFGLAACFMGAIKALSYYVPHKKLPSIHAYLIALGGLGAMTATAPVQFALHFISWHGVFYVLSVCTALTALLIYILSPKKHNYVNKTVTIGSLLKVYCEPTFRKTISLILIPHAVFFGVQGLWIGNYLRDVGNFSEPLVAKVLFLNMFAIVLGTVSIGKITEWMHQLGIKPVTVAGCGIMVFILVQLLILVHIQMTLPLLTILFMLFGACCGLEYTIIAQSVPPEMTGRAATCLNLLILSGAFIVQAGFGFIVGLWKPDLHQHYPGIAYQVAFGVMILLQLPGVLCWLFGNKNKHNVVLQETIR